MKDQGQRSNLSFFLFSSVYVLFEIVCVCVCVCLICLHRHHLTATSRRVKFTSNKKKVKVGKDQEKAQSEKRFPLQKPRWEKTKLTIRYLYYHENIS